MLNNSSDIEIWNAIHNRVNTDDRQLRVQSEWSSTRFGSFPTNEGETRIQTFEGMVQRLLLLQYQLPPYMQNENCLRDKVIDSIHCKQFADWTVEMR